MSFCRVSFFLCHYIGCLAALAAVCLSADQLNVILLNVISSWVSIECCLAGFILSIVFLLSVILLNVISLRHSTEY